MEMIHDVQNGPSWAAQRLNVVKHNKDQRIHKMDIDIRPLTKDLKDDYLFFFDHMVFKENPDWSICYCYDYHFTGDVATCTRESNRTAVIDLIIENKLTGYLVFENDKPIGWCNANNRLNYQRLLRDYDYIEAYPKKGELSSERNFKGPLDMYKRFDFKINKEYDDYYVMRKNVKTTASCKANTLSARQHS